MCVYNFNVAVRISISPRDFFKYMICLLVIVKYVIQVFAIMREPQYNIN